jgi:hypothetical protein
LENNEVLFYEFVQYILYNEHGTYLNLDENYTITIVDNDCNIVTIDRSQYIKFSSNKYEIMTRKKYIQKTDEPQISQEVKKGNQNDNEIENAIKMEEDIKTENVSELKTIHEIELEEAEEYLEWEQKELEHHVASYYAEENKKDELFKCDNCEIIYMDSTSKKIILLRDSYHENEETCLCEECYHLNDDTYNNRKWIKQ